MPPLDGTPAETVGGGQAPLEPPKDGTLVLAVGMGGMKTVRVVQWLAWKKGPIIVVTARRNLAVKIEADLTRAGVRCRNYLDPPPGVSTRAWCKFEAVIISGEQVHMLDEWKHMYAGGTLVIDEFGTLAASFGGTTIKWPQTTMAILKGLATVCSYTVMMDADVDADGKCEAFVKSVAPMNDVLEVRSGSPALGRTAVFGFRSNKAHECMFNDWLELSLHRSAESRRAGTQNLTFFGGTTPRQVADRAAVAARLGIRHGCYHGRSSEIERKRDFADADARMGAYDALYTSTVMAVGTDLSLKCSMGFFETARGSATHGVAVLRLLAQLMGRCGRSEGNPLDVVVVGGEAVDGALFVLIDDREPEASREQDAGRVERKFHVTRGEEGRRLRAARDADRGAMEAYVQRCGLRVDYGSGAVSLPTGAAPTSIEGALADIQTWNEVERRDQYEAHTAKLFELCLLPTRGFRLRPIQPLSAEQQAELGAFRSRQKRSPAAPLDLAEDRLVADMDSRGRYEFVRGYLAGADPPHPDSAPIPGAAPGATMGDFWHNCCGLIPRDETAQPLTDARGAALREVWSTLKDLKHLPPEEVYSDLHRDKDRRNVYARALMRFVPEADVKVDEVRAQKAGHAADTATAISLRAATKLPLLREFARAVKLSAADLLEPRTFTADAHEWVAAFNRMQGGAGAETDEAMASSARARALALGCKGIVARGAKPSGLLRVVEAVLEQECGMRPARTAKEGLVVRQLGRRGSRGGATLVSWRVRELAPGCAERMLVYHTELGDHVPAVEYTSRHARALALRDEERLQKRDRMERAQFEAEMEHAVDLGLPPAGEGRAVPAPYAPNVRYVPYDAERIRECLDDWGADDAARRAAEGALLEVSSALASAGVGEEDPRLARPRQLRRALVRLRVRHAIVANLDACLPREDERGETLERRTQREEYEYKEAAGGQARRYAVCEWRDYGDGRLRATTLPGMPNDLRPKLCGRYLRDCDGVNSDMVLIENASRRAGLPAGAYGHTRGHNLGREEWQGAVADHHLGHGVAPLHRATLVEAVKRWPNILANGGGYATCLRGAGLRESSPRCSPVVELVDELRQLRRLLLEAPCNKGFVARHRSRLQREMPGLAPHERENKVFSYLIETCEDEVLATVDATMRRLAREAVGREVFDATAPELRDTGGLIFDGLMTEHRDGMDMEGAMRVAEDELKAKGWDYRLAEKPCFGLQSLPVRSAVQARAALLEAIDAYPEVRAAVGEGRAAAKRRRLASDAPIASAREG